MIKIRLENVSSSAINIKELGIDLSASGIFIFTLEGERYSSNLPNISWDNLSSSQSLKDAVNASNIQMSVNDVVLSPAAAVAFLTSPTSGGGEANTASNVGTGAGQVFKQKVGVDLEFKTIKAGTNITVTNNADDITIDATGGAGEVNTASNVGAGAGVFKQKTGVDLEFKSVSSADFNVSGGTNEIEIQAAPAMITNQGSVTAASGMEVLLNDSGTLKRADVSGFLGGGGKEPYKQDSFMHEYILAKQKSANHGSRTTGFADGVARCNPFLFNQDVQIKGFGVNIITPRTADAYFGIYEFTSNTTPFTGAYTFTKVYQEPSVFSPSVAGSNTVTLTTPYTCTAGTMYAVILVMDNSVGGNVQFQTYQNLDAHPLAGFTPTALSASNKCRFFNASITITASTLPSTIDFNVNTDARFSGACYLKLKNV